MISLPNGPTLSAKRGLTCRYRPEVDGQETQEGLFKEILRENRFGAETIQGVAVEDAPWMVRKR